MKNRGLVRTHGWSITNQDDRNSGVQSVRHGYPEEVHVVQLIVGGATIYALYEDCRFLLAVDFECKQRGAPDLGQEMFDLVSLNFDGQGRRAGAEDVSGDPS